MVPARMAGQAGGAGGRGDGRRMTIPNLITIFRFCLVPLIVWCIVSQAWQPAFWVFAAAGVSDALDGFIAKRFDQKSDLGAILDPLADKALLVSIYLTLGILARLPAWFVILIVFRDLMILAAVLVAWVMGHKISIAPSMLSKVNTAAQILLAALVLLALDFRFDLDLLTDVGTAAVAILTIASSADYLRRWLRDMAGGLKDVP
jgi:cardiolipin synthase